MRWVFLYLPLCLVLSLVFSSLASGSAKSEPTSSLQYKRLVTREARNVFGLSAPIALFAGQIEQESAWRPEVCSAYACGLTQFTPGTADDIDTKYNLGGANRSNPTWAVRAQMLYMRDLYNTRYNSEADCDCDRWAFTLASYNGGYGWIRRDKTICDTKHGCDRRRWFGHVENWSNRAAWAFKENRGYPRRILDRNQYVYKTWGKTVACPALS